MNTEGTASHELEELLKRISEKNKQLKAGVDVVVIDTTTKYELERQELLKRQCEETLRENAYLEFKTANTSTDTSELYMAVLETGLSNYLRLRAELNDDCKRPALDNKHMKLCAMLGNIEIFKHLAEKTPESFANETFNRAIIVLASLNWNIDMLEFIINSVKTNKSTLIKYLEECEKNTINEKVKDYLNEKIYTYMIELYKKPQDFKGGPMPKPAQFEEPRPLKNEYTRDQLLTQMMKCVNYETHVLKAHDGKLFDLIPSSAIIELLDRGAYDLVNQLLAHIPTRANLQLVQYPKLATTLDYILNIVSKKISNTEQTNSRVNDCLLYYHDRPECLKVLYKYM